MIWHDPYYPKERQASTIRHDTESIVCREMSWHSLSGSLSVVKQPRAADLFESCLVSDYQRLRHQQHSTWVLASDCSGLRHNEYTNDDTARQQFVRISSWTMPDWSLIKWEHLLLLQLVSIMSLSSILFEDARSIPLNAYDCFEALAGLA